MSAERDEGRRLICVVCNAILNAILVYVVPIFPIHWLIRQLRREEDEGDGSLALVRKTFRGGVPCFRHPPSVGSVVLACLPASCAVFRISSSIFLLSPIWEYNYGSKYYSYSLKRH